MICSCLWLVFKDFATIKSNFNYFGHCCDFVTIIDNFIIWVEWILCLFSSMNRLICPINHNNHQVSYTELEISYGDLGEYFYVCIQIIFKIYYPYDKYVFFCLLIMHMYVQCSYIEPEIDISNMKLNI